MMTRNLLVGSLSLALIAFAPIAAFAGSSFPVVSQAELASICDNAKGAGDHDVMLSLGNGNSVAITVHCDPSAMVVGATTDIGESEKGPTEAAENGIED